MTYVKCYRGAETRSTLRTLCVLYHEVNWLDNVLMAGTVHTRHELHTA